MGKIIKTAKNIIIKLDDFREEKLEDFIANEILAKVETSSKIDELEKQAIIAGITAANAYMATYGIPTLPDEIKQKIADAGVKTLNKANKMLQRQLKKKSKGYQKRHMGENKND